ncbi:MAG: hypothetical protein IJN54_01645 [Lachnospiraceae bacterium]|nr:hypothetical protein [Lachnospiraceae bacterium]
MKQKKNQDIFNIDENNDLLSEYFAKENYKEVLVNLEKNLCYIFFSGNGLYFPNTVETFKKTIIKNNRYEWENIANSPQLLQKAGKYIFLRDLYKSWYIKGINNSVDSIDKLYVWLKERTEGYRIITVGNSAGGYMAALMGSLLKAEMVFDFSGQFSLYATKDVLTKYALLKKYSADEERRKYFDICEYLKHNESIMYFWPGNSEFDITQYELVKATKIYSFKFKARIHGQSMYSANIPYLLVQDKQYLVNLYKHYEGKDIVKEEFFIRTRGVKALVKMYLSILKKKITKS